jgi:very-long-chain ceramide synthase
MPGTLKPYYLLQTAFWLQQSMLLGLGVEKPRRDFYEFVAHHIITLWMVIWSYIMNMTFTGNIIFLTMDWSEIFFAVSLGLLHSMWRDIQCELAASQMFQLLAMGTDQDDCVCLVRMLLDVSVGPARVNRRLKGLPALRRYSRHYLNFKILYSHWYEFDLISDDMKGWYPSKGLWMVWWMKHQMFFALLGLQCLNIFWYFLLWRILLRCVSRFRL